MVDMIKIVFLFMLITSWLVLALGEGMNRKEKIVVGIISSFFLIITILFIWGVFFIIRDMELDDGMFIGMLISGVYLGGCTYLFFLIERKALEEQEKEKQRLLDKWKKY
ncbi:hypothetical protein SAMN04487866_12216 [Thermoactinomyces sp. DSM 45891]|uniref:hypothetical protein n=1 Tax=Thermoactinomyces sp. DSM 45891 TaxID=1761907 RepID=UPI00090F5A1A|nr:hypothetical protein [Thermoactinomyces sp. DSM 45891]SFX74770.1 hypothetical protein SAMN04487866_12216 [Thermoactinomyces sp. DSM 45891]